MSKLVEQFNHVTRAYLTCSTKGLNLVEQLLASLLLAAELANLLFVPSSC